MDKYKIKDYTERLKKVTTENAHKMLYMWIKQDVISLSEYKELVKCNIPDVRDSDIIDLLDSLNDDAREYNGHEYGLPVFSSESSKMITTVKNWLKWIRY